MKRDTFPPYMTAAGFEPAKRDAQDLKSRPVDQTRERCLNCLHKKDFIHDGIWTRNLEIRSLTRYPIAPHGLHGGGFEPPKQMHMILSHAPLTRLGYPCLIERYFSSLASSGAWTRDLGLIRPAL